MGHWKRFVVAVYTEVVNRSPGLKSRFLTQNPTEKSSAFPLAVLSKQVQQEKKKVSGSSETFPRLLKYQRQSLHWNLCCMALSPAVPCPVDCVMFYCRRSLLLSLGEKM